MTYPPNAPVPPAAPAPAPAVKAPPAGWIAAAAGLLGLLALVLPWYQPKLAKAIGGQQVHPSAYHAWSGFFFLVIGPLALIVFGVLWVQALIGRSNSRFAGAVNPLRSLSMQSIVAGAVAIVIALVSYPLVKSHYKDWDTVAKLAKESGTSLSRGPQIGLYLLVLGGLLMIVAGAIGMTAKAPVAAAPQFDGQQFRDQQFGTQQYGAQPQEHPQQPEHPQQQNPGYPQQ